MQKSHNLVILVDESNNQIGTASKGTVHGKNTPLHRAFSVFLMNSHDQVLLQQRSASKPTWSLVWSGSCCGHVAPGETTEAAIRRGVEHELGIPEIKDLHVVLPDFRYRAQRDGVVENEICPVWVGEVQGEPILNSDEVADCRWEPWPDFVKNIQEKPGEYSDWAVLQVNEYLKTKV